ncbi:hypothetical protein L8V01_10755 [Corynebacterium sp. c8Ua_181]|uniref:Ketosynthase family 3 (KS3) domain-containing protein n=1 Tax=Corynebacterium curieae TaxID=2913500 RepID=A0A9X3MEL2_9CORY|nr:beta-ketoacyl synthase N-terminal-like domain-containing protein [Corynebacterium curieae]MCZ9307948.1 hypothetical protein [Corynebacterium curieae]
MWIYDYSLNLENYSQNETIQALREGVKLDSFSKHLAGPKPPLPAVPKCFNKFTGISTDINFRSILQTAAHLKLPKEGITGVFITVGNPQNATTHKTTSRYGMYDMLPGIISYGLNLKGLGIYTASTCDSFGSAITLAKALNEGGYIDNAIILASNMEVGAEAFKATSILSESQRCAPFTTLRNGSWPGLGYGGITLSKQRTEKSKIQIVGAYTANAGNDRASFLAPSVQAQQTAINSAWLKAGFPLKEASFIETHGTGTRIGDALEIDALRRCYHSSHSSKEKIVLGASKELTGHLDAASGLVSLVRSIDLLKNQQTPSCSEEAICHEDKELLSPEFQLGDGTKHVKQNGLAGVTMIGIAGSTTHIVLKRENEQSVLL